MYVFKMGDGAIDESLVEQFTCPICFEYMDNKIYICSNGHSLCKICNSKIGKCPICKVKLNSQRNITFEKAAKKLKEWKAKKELLPIESISLKRKQRFSLGSPSKVELEGDIFGNNQIQCPCSKCCYFAKHLLQLKIHLNTWHPKELFQIKKSSTAKSENAIGINLRWDRLSVYKMFILTASEAFFIIYVVRSPTFEKKSSLYVNVLTVSDKTDMYKFTCGTSTKFSMFYQGRHQAREGIVVDDSALGKGRVNDRYTYVLRISLIRVASLRSSVVKINNC